MISSVKVYIKKYVKASGVYEIAADSIGIEMSDVKFKALKLKRELMQLQTTTQTDLC